MEKLLPMEELFEKLEQNGFHQPENQFPLASMKNLLKNKFKLGGIKALTIRSIGKMEKSGFHEPKNPFPLARMKDLFQK